MIAELTEMNDRNDWLDIYGDDTGTQGGSVKHLHAVSEHGGPVKHRQKDELHVVVWNVVSAAPDPVIPPSGRTIASSRTASQTFDIITTVHCRWRHGETTTSSRPLL